MNQLPEVVELSDAELDLVTGGARGGLVNVDLNLSRNQIDILRNADINVDIVDDVTLRNIANNNNVGVGAVIQLLGGVAAIRQSQAQ